MLYFVYRLIDRRRVGVRAVYYVGITDNPNKRYRHHLRCDDGESEEKNAWIRGLLADGTTPKMEIIEVIDGERAEALAREAYWIKYYTSQGAPLLNYQHQQHYHEARLRHGKAGAIIKNALFTHYYEQFLERTIEGWDWGRLRLSEEPTYPRAKLEWSAVFSPYWLWGDVVGPKRYERYAPSERPEYWEGTWASIGLLPLDEAYIHRLLRRDVLASDIQASDILSWTPGQHYTCYVVSALYRRGKERHQADVFRHALVSLASLGVFLDKLYVDVRFDSHDEKGQVVPDGMYLTRLVKEQYFSPEPSLSPSTWVVYPEQPSLSPAIQAYRERAGLMQVR